MSTRKCVYQAAAIPFRLSPRGGVHILLITTGSGRWGIPKGYIEPGEDRAQAAVREAIEEAGVVGTLMSPRLGEFRYERGGEEHRVSVFALRVEDVLSRWSERKARRRAWVPLREALRAISRPEVREMLRKIDAAMLRDGRVLRQAV